MGRSITRPEQYIEYTFRRYDFKKDKFMYDTYVFTGEVTEKGRFVFFEVRKGYFMNCTIEGWSYMCRKRFVRKKDSDGKISRRVEDLTALEKAVMKAGKKKPAINVSKTERFCKKAILELKSYPPITKEDIYNHTGVEVDSLIQKFQAVLQMPENVRQTCWNSLMNQYLKVASHQGVALVNIV